MSDVTLTYDVYLPQLNSYDAVPVTVSGRALAQLGTAFQLPTADIAGKMVAYNAAGPAVGKMMFYPLNPKTLATVSSGSTANGYGHWFDADGQVTSYANGILYSEFYPSAMSFVIGQYPGRCQAGSTYTLRQTLLYKQNNKNSARANFVFYVTIGGTTPSATLHSIEYNDPTGIHAITNYELRITNGSYDLQGRRVSESVIRNSELKKGLYIINGQKVLVK